MTPPTLVTCPHCHAQLRVKPKYFGHEGVCKFCEKTFFLNPPVDANAVTPDPDTGEGEGEEPAEGSPSALEKLWEDEASKSQQPAPIKPLRSAPPRPSLTKKPAIDLEDSSMIIPVRKDDGPAGKAPRAPEAKPVFEPPKPPPRPPVVPPPSVDHQAQARARTLKSEIEERERRVAEVEVRLQAEREQIAQLRAELETVEKDAKPPA